MLIADEFFLIAHSDSRGRAVLNPTAAGFGLAAALLGELVLSGHLAVGDGSVSVVERDPPAELLVHNVWDQLLAERHHREVRTWLTFLGQTAVSAVGERLSRAGLMCRQESRRLLRTTVSFVPTDLNALAWPATRLRALLDQPDRRTVPDVFLLGLVTATGLTREVLWSAGPRVDLRLDPLLSALPGPFRELVVFTEAAVGAAVLRT